MNENSTTHSYSSLTVNTLKNLRTVSDEEKTGQWAAQAARAVLDLEVRFRVLIIGRANSGKTTLLERLCQSSFEEAEVYRDGKLTDRRMKGEHGRGAHEITDETVFPSLPGFVFHDSCGIEAGSFDEVVEIECFVKNRSLLVKNKHKQLHAIWICLPLDTDRPLLQAEKSLCRLNSGDVPIIAIFTKYDARYTKFLAELINCAPVPGRAAMRKVKADANERAGRWVDDLRRTLDSDEECPHPSAYMTAPDLQEASVDNKTFCQALMLNTQNLLPSSKMQALLVTVWRNNVSERSVWLFRCILNENNGLFPTGEITKKAVAELVAIFLPATHGNPREDIQEFEQRTDSMGPVWRDIQTIYGMSPEHVDIYPWERKEAAALLEHCAPALDPNDTVLSRGRAVIFTAFLIIIQRKVIFTTKLPAGRMLPYGRELKKVMGHPAVEDALSALEREVAESYCADAKHGSQLAEEDVILAAQRLTEIVGDNLLHEE